MGGRRVACVLCSEVATGDGGRREASVEVGDSGKICESGHLPFSIHRRAVRSARPEDLISVSLSAW
jgi:hypothetical protein